MKRKKVICPKCGKETFINYEYSDKEFVMLGCECEVKISDIKEEKSK